MRFLPKLIATVFPLLTLMPQISAAAVPQVTDDISKPIAPASATAACTVGLWIAPKFDYDLQSLWGGVAGVLGQALADEANSDKLIDRRNELEKTLTPEVVYGIITSANFQNIRKKEDLFFLPLQSSPVSQEQMKNLVNSKVRNSEFSGECYYEIYVTKVSAYKTIVYGTFLDSNFRVKKFTGRDVSGTHSNSIRRKIKDFPAKSPEETAASREGVRKIFAEEFQYFLDKAKF